MRVKLLSLLAFFIMVASLMSLPAYAAEADWSASGNGSNDNLVAIPIADTEEPAYAILYESGDLVFQRGNTHDSSRGGFVQEWTGFESADGKTTSMWSDAEYSYRVKKVVFKDAIAPGSLASFFQSLDQMESIEGIEKLDTSQATSMYAMFYHCYSLKSLDVSHFNTANVTNMSKMFYGDYQIEQLNVSGFNTANVTDASGMFSTCQSVGSLDVSHFNTSNMTDMNAMFYGCSSLESINLSSFDTTKVTNLGNMFGLCTKLSSIDLSKFNTSKVTDMRGLFQGCAALTTVSLAGLDTSEVGKFSSMFSGCSSLQTVNLTGVSTAKATTLNGMFRDCSSLTSLDVAGFDTRYVTDTSYMFQGCSSLTAIDLSRFDSTSLKQVIAMFKGCSSLAALNVSTITPHDCTNLSSMFEGCSSLTELNVSTLAKYSNGRKDLSRMFAGCTSLETLDASKLALYSPSATTSMFEGCSSLTSIDLTGFKTGDVTNYAFMFSGCSSLASLDISSFSLVGSPYKSNMFNGCTKLSSITFGKGFDLEAGASSSGNVGLPDITAVGYTGRWMRTVDDMTTYATSAELMALSGDDLTGTWAWEEGQSQGAIDITGATVTLSQTSYAYDGTAKRPSVVSVALPGGEAVPASGYDVSYSGECVNAGTYAVTVTGKGDYTGSASASYVIGKASAGLSFASPSREVEVGSAAFANALSKATDAAATYSSGNAAVATVDPSTGAVMPRAVGTATITATVPESANYSGGSASFTVTVKAQAAPAYAFEYGNLTYRFGNHWDYFGYPRDYVIPLDIYERVFSPLLAEKYRDKDIAEGGWGGNCYGMSTTSSMFNTPASGISVKGFSPSVSRVYDLNVSDRSAALGLTVTQFIEVMQVSQYNGDVQRAYNNNTNLGTMALLASSAASGAGQPVVIAVFGPRGGHALLGYRLERVDASVTRLYVYDCNYPGVEARYVTLYTDARGRYTGWYYPMNGHDYGSGYRGCNIAYVPYATYINPWNNRREPSVRTFTTNSASYEVVGPDGAVVASVVGGELVDAVEGVYPCRSLSVVAGEGEGRGTSCRVLYLPDEESYKVVNKDSSVGRLEASMTDSEQSASVSTSAGAATFEVSDTKELNRVSVDAAEGEAYSLRLQSTLPSAVGQEDVELSGTGEGGSVSLGTSGGERSVEGTASAKLTVNGKEVPVDGKSDLATYAGKAKAAGFTDLDPNGWYMNDGGKFPDSSTLYLDYTIGRKLMSGYTGTTLFGPDDQLTRGMAATIIYRMATGATAEDTDNDVSTKFPDVKSGAWYAAAVKWCADEGVVTGYTDGSGRFGPDDPITREQLATIIGRYMDKGKAAGEDVSQFKDEKSISGYAKAGIAYCSANGIMTGVGDTGIFDPKGLATRCQMSKVIAVTARMAE